MANLLKCLILLIVIIVSVLNINSKNDRLLSSPKSFVSISLSDINHSIKPLPNEVIDFLKTSSDYKDIYKDKKVVIYFTGADCPYGKVFEKSINEFRKNSASNVYFNFHTESASGIRWYKSNQEAKAALQYWVVSIWIEYKMQMKKL